jgi:hypothetical protein
LDLTGSCRKPHNKLQKYTPHQILLGRLRWDMQHAWINKKFIKLLVIKLKGRRNHIGDQGIAGRIILKWILQN